MICKSCSEEYNTDEEILKSVGLRINGAPFKNCIKCREKNRTTLKKYTYKCEHKRIKNACNLCNKNDARDKYCNGCNKAFNSSDIDTITTVFGINKNTGIPYKTCIKCRALKLSYMNKKSADKTCKKTYKKCAHNVAKHDCRLCNLCPHNRHKSKCKECYHLRRMAMSMSTNGQHTQ